MSYRTAAGKQIQRSTKIEHTPDAADAKQRAALAGEAKRAAQALADEIERAERGHGGELHLRKLFDEMAQRLYGASVTPPTAREYLLNWLETRNLAAGTLARYGSAVRLFIEHLGERANLPFDRITVADVEAFSQARLKAGFSAVTVRTDRKVLASPFGAATRAGLLIKNPVANAETIEATSEEKLPFSRSEIEALLRSAQGTEWETMIHLGAFAGLRIGDAAALTWDSVDLFAGQLTFRPQKTARKKRDLSLPMAARLVKHLATLPTPHRGPICPTLARKSVSGKSGLSEAFNKLMARAGIDSMRVEPTGEGRAFNRKSFHSTRHFFNTELERAGVGEDLRMKLSGQTTAAINRRYTHTEIETLAAAVAGL